MDHPPQAPAGWYPDPDDPGFQRYWSGTGWTAHRAPAPTSSPEAPPPPTSSRGAPGATAVSRLPWWQTGWAIVLGLILFLPLGLFALWKRPGLSGSARWVFTVVSVVVVALALALPDDDDTSSPTRAAEHSPSARFADEPTEEPPQTPADDSPPPEEVPAEVPRLVGQLGKEVGTSLRESGLRLGAVERVPSREPRGTVLEQSIDPGESVDNGDAVDVVIASPMPKVPYVVGMSRADAVAQLKAAGFRVTTSRKDVTTSDDGKVLSQSPGRGSRPDPGSTVRLVVSRYKAPPPLASNCTPGYDPCLPPKSDYDCAGGAGDGPGYTGLVHVSGSDPYDLDRDGDGIGCD